MDTFEQNDTSHPLHETVSSHIGAIHKVVYAGFFPRFIAYLIDLIVIWSINTIVTRPLLNLMNLSEAKLWINLFSASNITTSIIFFAYFILLTYFFRATLGKMIMGLSVESLIGSALSTKQVIFRECIGRYISMAFLGLPYLVVLFTKRYQGIHDYFADTSVIKNKMKQFKEEVKTALT
ncbi:RDD family protein [Pontibacillus yanchengensis]|uniref:RDD family protein n=1 Tax=Pontibacillus yanchengensis TaxID=462910 RepID=A0A6I5A6P9_9BACI|nr:RDD family protein [Pontibacillus yanchengensis]MYL36080.1 RDD family protein [Pontibacillus yanchengensis]